MYLSVYYSTFEDFAILLMYTHTHTHTYRASDHKISTYKDHQGQKYYNERSVAFEAKYYTKEIMFKRMQGCTYALNAHLHTTLVL